MQQVHQRIIARQSIKMKGYVAVQRKLLILIYTLWKNNQPYKFLEQPVEAAPNRAGLDPLSFFLISKLKNIWKLTQNLRIAGVLMPRQ